MGDLSQHFDRREFRDKRTGELKGPDPKLVVVLEAIRATQNRPLILVSAYRSPETNRAVGGAKASQHLAGRAADIPPGWVTPEQAKACGARGVGVSREGWAVHVDVRPGPPATWFY